MDLAAGADRIAMDIVLGPRPVIADEDLLARIGVIRETGAEQEIIFGRFFAFDDEGGVLRAEKALPDRDRRIEEVVRPGRADLRHDRRA